MGHPSHLHNGEVMSIPPNPKLEILERFVTEFPEFAETFLLLFWAHHRWSVENIVHAEESQERLLEATGHFDMVELMRALQGTLRRSQIEKEELEKTL